jgi:hypothetical protein
MSAYNGRHSQRTSGIRTAAIATAAQQIPVRIRVMCSIHLLRRAARVACLTQYKRLCARQSKWFLPKTGMG